MKLAAGKDIPLGKTFVSPLFPTHGKRLAPLTSLPPLNLESGTASGAGCIKGVISLNGGLRIKFKNRFYVLYV